MRLNPLRPANVVRLLLLVAMVAPFPSIWPAGVALACSGPGPSQPAERFAGSNSDALPGPDSIALLGAVLDETEIETMFRTVFLSKVQTVVPLAGDGITNVVRVGPNGFGAPDCSGGPRLFSGEKVMLFLYESRGVLGEGDPIQFGDWQSGQFGTPILFDGADAYYLSWGRFADQGDGSSTEQRIYVGDSEEVLGLALTYFEVTAEQREQAFQFVLGKPAPQSPVPAPTATAPADGVRIAPPDTGSAGLLPK